MSAGLLVGLQGFAQDAKPMSDAQVESNVLKALAGSQDLSAQNIQTSVVYGDRDDLRQRAQRGFAN